MIGQRACLAHLRVPERDAYLASLSAGADIDHRGTPFTQDLLARLLNALRDPANSKPVIGRASLTEASFQGEADFTDVTFTGPATLRLVEFQGYALFRGARFEEPAIFSAATFRGEANFEAASFSGPVDFSRAKISGNARFRRAAFSGFSRFNSTRFEADAQFQHASFADASFTRAEFTDWSLRGASFSRTSSIGPLTCIGRVDLTGCVFESPIRIEIAAAEVRCVGTRWESTAHVLLRYATLDLSDAVLTAPTAVTAHAAPFKPVGKPLSEATLRRWGRSDPSVQVVSISGVDAAQLVLTDTDLTDCRFIGAFHLDQLRIEGRTRFARVPQGLRLRGRWSQRRVLAEEHHWRAQHAGQRAPIADESPSERLWRTGPHHKVRELTPDPEDVAAVYRQLRKALEDGKNEPGAADFYYGEMEMRRHSRDDTTRAERGLLHLYWLLSGYGLRASRAFTWLALLMLTTILLMMGLGLPQHSPKQEASGIVPAGGGRVTYTIDKEDPQNPTTNWFTTKRFEKALNVTLNSVVFRSSGQDLTTTGTYVEMASRLFEPALLALGVLAIRGRIKR